MNRIQFYKDEKKVKAELQEVKQVDPDGAVKMFKVHDKPVYLQMFVHRKLLLTELIGIYNDLVSFGLVELTKEDIDYAVREDIEKDQPFCYEIRCKDFEKAFKYAVMMAELWDDDSLTIQLSDEPTEEMKHWMSIKDPDAMLTSVKNTLNNEGV